MMSGTDDALSAVRAALAARDGELAAADEELVAVLHAAHRDGISSVRRIDAVASAIDAAAAGRIIDGPAAGREFGAFLVERNREIRDIVTDAHADVAAKTIALQQLSERYRGTAQR
jgi:PHP family Zn ribbon phosphoesterase